MNSFDARVRYTKMIIQQSFLELLQKKHVTRITVTELCQKAQINRAIFYKHYLDVPDLFEKIEEELFDGIRKAFSEATMDWEGVLVSMLHYTRQEKERYFALGGANGDPELMAKSFQVCYESIFPMMSRELEGMEENEKQMLYQFLSYGGGGILTWWIHDGMREAPEKVAQYLIKVCGITVEGMRPKK